MDVIKAQKGKPHLLALLIDLLLGNQSLCTIYWCLTVDVGLYFKRPLPKPEFWSCINQLMSLLRIRN